MKKKLKIVFIALAAVLIFLAAAFFIYANNFYRADDTALQLLENNPKIQTEGSLTILTPDEESTVGLIFYPGAKVEHTAYLPLLNLLREKGITCVLVEMPFRFAFFNPNAADDARKALPNITSWFIGGHSLGGAMAGNYAGSHKDSIRGLILLGAYIYGDVSPSDALIIYGSNDLVLNRSKIDDTENVVVIEGGNHAQFGNYGIQKGDGSPECTAKYQQQITAEEIQSFLNSHMK